MLDEDTNGVLLRLFHCFLHSAPQAVLQLTILLYNINTVPGKFNEIQTGKNHYIIYIFSNNTFKHSK